MTRNTTTVELCDDVFDHVRLYERLFNEGNAAKLDQLYTEDGVSAWEADQPLTGAERAAAFEEFLAMRPTMSATVLESHITGDAALIVVDWRIDIAEDDQHFAGIGIDVLRRGPDDKWRHAVDSPFGGGRK